MRDSSTHAAKIESPREESGEEKFFYFSGTCLDDTPREDWEWGKSLYGGGKSSFLPYLEIRLFSVKKCPSETFFFWHNLYDRFSWGQMTEGGDRIVLPPLFSQLTREQGCFQKLPKEKLSLANNKPSCLEIVQI